MKTQSPPRNRIPWRLALLALIAGCAVARAADTTQFDNANRLYEAGKFADARDAYQQMVRSGPISANLYYNLGNTEWKLGDGGQAAVDYERALMLEPSHPEATANLNFVREQTGAKTATLQWWQTALDVLNANTASLLLSLCGWAALFSVAIIVIKPGPHIGTAVALTISLLGAAYAGGCLWQTNADATRAVVIEKSVQAREAPADVAPIADVLPAGSEVLSPEERGPWTYCTLPDGTRAWVPTEALERVKPA
jgi:tetratricopeptide (TPR) repeat protein